MFLGLSDVFVGSLTAAEIALREELLVFPEPILHTLAGAGGQIERAQQQILGLRQIVLAEQIE